MVSASTSCPAGYTMITSDYPGTETHCDKGYTYSVGSCSSDESGWTVYGVKKDTFEEFDGMILCYKRANNLNYMKIFDARLEDPNFDSCPGGQHACGPDIYSYGYTYC